MLRPSTRCNNSPSKNTNNQTDFIEIGEDIFKKWEGKTDWYSVKLKLAKNIPRKDLLEQLTPFHKHFIAPPKSNAGKPYLNILQLDSIQFWKFFQIQAIKTAPVKLGKSSKVWDPPPLLGCFSKFYLILI